MPYSPFSLLARLRSLPRDIFAKIEHLNSQVQSSTLQTSELRTQVATLARQLQANAGQWELIKQVATLQDDLVRRQIAERNVLSDIAMLDNTVSASSQAVTRRVEALGRDLQGMQASMDDLSQSVKRERHMREAQAVFLPSWLADYEAGERVRRSLACLAPAAAERVGKVRLGRPHDGGYVSLDDFSGVDAALSLGINDDVSWDLEIAERGIPVYQYDPTIEALPQEHTLFHFAPLWISDEDGPTSLSLESAIRQRVEVGQTRLILKVDIEGSEWDALDGISPETLAHCTQILCEFHHLERLADADFGARAERVLRKLAESFFVCHVHGNNCGNLAIVGNVPVPESLEVTFANKSRYRSVPTNDVFPTPIDMPNQEGRADFYLGAFRF